jgi:Gpi18-like mannosyltransferase
MFGVALIIRVLLFSTQGYQNDMNTFISWFNTATDFGPRLFYNTVSWCDYPPFNVYLFWSFGSLTQALGLFGTSYATYIVKLVPNIFDMLIGGLIYLFVRKQFSFKLALLASAFYIFNPAIIFNAAVWGQFDAVYTFFMLFSLILALKRQPELSAASFAISILTKPQAIALLPIVAFVIFKKSGIKRFLFSIAAFAATIFAVILPMQWSNPINFLYDIYFGAYTGYACTSINAFNTWGLLHGMWIPDGNLFILGWILFATFSVFTIYVINKQWNKLSSSSDQWLIFFAAFMILFAFFMLPTRIHERYLFPAISMLALITPFVKKARIFYVVITATFLSNIAYVLYWLNLYAKANYPYSPNLSNDPVVIVVGVINVIMFLFGSLLLWRELRNKNTTKNGLSESSEPKTGFIESGEVVGEGVSELRVEPPPVKRSFVFSFNITKKDVITMVLLSLIFFSIAITSLGATQVPSSGLKIADEQPQAAILDLGHITSVSAISFYIKDSQDTKIKIYTNQYDSWFESGTITVTFPYAYMNWHSLNIQDTRYIRLEFEALANIEINELAVLDVDNQLVPIISITGENSSSLNFGLLIDEQDLVVLPKTYLTETMFDEVYFTRTAEQYLNHQLPYEWTHPPLGKLIIASGIATFGLTPFGWRIMGVIFGTLMIPIIFLLGKKMFGSYIGGFSAAFLFTFDFMHFTEARLGITDTYLAFFSIVSQLFFFIYIGNVVRKGWKNASVIPLFFSFLLFALGFSTKWLILFGFLGAMAILIIMRLSDLKNKYKNISDKFYAFFEYPYVYVMLFIIMAVGIYFAIYIPDMLAGRSLMNVAQLQDSMYSYHAGPIGLDHPYSSPGWSWPIIGKPLWIYVNNLPADMRSTISVFGNPAVWWIGFAAIITITGITLLKAVVDLKKRQMPSFELSAAFLSVVFFAQWLPYAFISRGLFIYHYYVSVPIICLASAYFISKYWKYNWMKVLALVYFVAVIALFVLFYPVISGTPVSTATSESLRWFSQWVF